MTSSLATFAAVQTSSLSSSSSVRGLAGSSIRGMKLVIKPASQKLSPRSVRFFGTFAAPFTKRGLLHKFLILGGGSTLAYFSATSSGDILPTKKGPQLPPKLGPCGKI